MRKGNGGRYGALLPMVVAAGLAAVVLSTATPALAGAIGPGTVEAWPGGMESATAPDPVPTRVVVRVVSHDAKIIGSGVGGARVTIRHRETGEVLAQGIQQGSTGSTEEIMRNPHERGGTVYGTEGAAAFETTLQLAEPTPVTITARGPLGTPHAEQTASASMVLVPGHHVTGEGVVLTLYGFTVEILEPVDEGALEADDDLPVTVRITMLCGCPTEPGGMWDARRIHRRVQLLNADDEVVAESGLEFTGETSTYAAMLEAPAPGSYTLLVTAVDADRANAGTATRTVVVARD